MSFYLCFSAHLLQLFYAILLPPAVEAPGLCFPSCTALIFD